MPDQTSSSSPFLAGAAEGSDVCSQARYFCSISSSSSDKTSFSHSRNFLLGEKSHNFKEMFHEQHLSHSNDSITFKVKESSFGFV